MQLPEILMIIFIIAALIFAGLYFLNKWAAKKMGAQQTIIEKTKQDAMIFIIDKKRDSFKNVNLPKVVTDNIPKYSKLMKMYFVQAKVGPRVTTLMCDKRVFGALPVKKNVKVELAGLYIVGVKGMKSEAEMKEKKKVKEEKVKAAKKEAKAAEKKNK